MTHVLVEVVGFLGLGGEVVRVPINALRVTDNQSTFVLETAAERFEAGLRLEGEALETVDDLDWREQNDLYYTLAETEFASPLRSQANRFAPGKAQSPPPGRRRPAPSPLPECGHPVIPAAAGVA